MNNLDLSILTSAPTQADTAIALLEYWIQGDYYPKSIHFPGIEAAIAIVEGLNQQQLAEFTDYHPLDLVWEGKEVLRIAQERYENEPIEPSVAIANKNYPQVTPMNLSKMPNGVGSSTPSVNQLSNIANSHGMYCDYASNRPQMPISTYCNHQYFENGVLVFDMDSLAIWSFENADKAGEFIKKYNSISDDDFRSYLQTILWSETDEDSDPLDDSYDVDDFDHEGSQQQRKECESFIAENREAVDFLLENGIEMSTILHNFWLTRCGHGSGFWDSPEKFDPYTEQLTDSSKRYGEKWVYIGDDGVIYF